MTFVLPTPQPVLHDNFCFLRVDGFYSSETDCGKFLRCHNSRGSLTKCPANLLWQPAKDGKNGFCDWPRNVECGSRPRPVTTTTTTTTVKPTTTTTSSKTICDQRGEGFFPDPASCRNFFRCLPGVSKPVALQCPLGLYFNPTGFNRGNCNFPQNVCCFGTGKRNNCSPGNQ